MEAVVLCLILGTGVYFTIKTRCVQVRRFSAALRSALPEGAPGKGVSSFEAGCTALAATIGTGNIAGVAGAVLIAGPGVLFWMWISAFFGMAVKYTEILFALRWRVRTRDGFLGGPMVTIERGLGPKYRPLAILWCALCLCSALGMGCIVQVSTVIGAAESLASALGFSIGGAFRSAVAGSIALMIFLSILGGAKRVGRIAAFLVPVMSLVYLVGAGAILIRYIGRLPAAFCAILEGAFRPEVMGFSFLYVAATGLNRGTFTHEAGLGTSALAHASAEVKDPRRQALFGVFEVFLDTIVICTVTGLALLVSGIPLSPGADASRIVVTAFQTILPDAAAAAFLAVSMLLFAFSSILSFSLYGEKCISFLGGRALKIAYLLMFVGAIAFSGRLSSGAAWRIADTMNVLLAFPNLAALILLAIRNPGLFRDAGKTKAPG